MTNFCGRFVKIRRSKIHEFLLYFYRGQFLEKVSTPKKQNLSAFYSIFESLCQLNYFYSNCQKMAI